MRNLQKEAKLFIVNGFEVANVTTEGHPAVLVCDRNRTYLRLEKYEYDSFWREVGDLQERDRLSALAAQRVVASRRLRSYLQFTLDFGFE